MEVSQRPGLAELISDIEEKVISIDALLVWKTDRLGRSLRQVVNTVHFLERHNIALESCTEKIDTSSPSGKVLFSTICAFSQFESEVTGERTLNAMSSKVGEIHLGGKAPFGYQLVNGRLQKDPNAAPKVELIFNRYLRWRSLSKVADYLNKEGFLPPSGKPWSYKTVSYVLARQVVTGDIVWGRRAAKSGRKKNREQWIIKPDTHEAIISKNIFNRVQRLLAKDS